MTCFDWYSDKITTFGEELIKRRKSMKITQKKLAERTMVSYASIRRFETTGEISLSSLMRLALALDCLEDFEKLFANEFIFDLEDL